MSTASVTKELWAVKWMQCRWHHLASLPAQKGCHRRGGRHPGTHCCVCSSPLRHSVCVRDIATLLSSPQRAGTYKTKLLLEASTCSSELFLKKRPAAYFQLGGPLPPPPPRPLPPGSRLHPLPTGMRCIEVALLYSRVSSTSRSRNYLWWIVCVRVSLWQFTLPGSAELISFNLAAQPQVLSFTLFSFIQLQPPSDHSSSTFYPYGLPLTFSLFTNNPLFFFFTCLFSDFPWCPAKVWQNFL